MCRLGLEGERERERVILWLWLEVLKEGLDGEIKKRNIIKRESGKKGENRVGGWAGEDAMQCNEIGR